MILLLIRNPAVDPIDPAIKSMERLDGRVGIDWGVYGAPETFLLDENGIILYKLVGPLTPDIWVNEFVPRIAAARGETTGETM